MLKEMSNTATHESLLDSRLNWQLKNIIRHESRKIWRRFVLLFLLIVGFVCFVASIACRNVYGYYDGTFILLAVAIAAFVSLFIAAYLFFVIQRLEKRLLVIITVAARENIDLLAVLGRLIELRDNDTSGHNLRVSIYALLFAEAMNFTPTEVVQFTKGAYVHDIGKLAIPEDILKKPEALTLEERSCMEQHVARGMDIANESQFLKDALPIISTHHERYDGSGYPHGLQGNEIPLMGRMFSLIDVFDALTTQRVYKKPLETKEALQIMQKGSGSQFDPFLYDQFLKFIQKQEKILSTNEDNLMAIFSEKLTPYLDIFLLKEALNANHIRLDNNAHTKRAIMI